MPSVLHHLQQAQGASNTTQEALQHTAEHYCHQTEHQRSPALQYSQSQKVWLCAKDIPLKVSSRNCLIILLCPLRLTLWSVPWLLSLSSLPRSRSPLLSMSPKVMSVSSSPLCPLADPTSARSWTVFWMSITMVSVSSTSWTGMVTVLPAWISTERPQFHFTQGMFHFLDSQFNISIFSV